jgi:PBP1b-binding outer membrane lipoprotein LpoB
MRSYKFIMSLAILIVLAGCSGQDKGGTAGEKNAADSLAASPQDKSAIEAALTEYIDRVKEGDMTVLYENEFSYYRAENSLSQYMENKRVSEYKYDTLSGVVINDIKIRGDTATLMIKVTYQSVSGESKERPYSITMYRDMGRWIRPYLSQVRLEREYLDEVKAYKEAVSHPDSD